MFVYFIFQQNNKEIPSKFPISWTEGEAFKITRDGDFSRLLDQLNPGLFSEYSRSFYFAVLMISIALTGAGQAGVSRNEYISLRSLLETVLENGASGNAIEIKAQIRQLPENLSWLSYYMPESISPPQVDSSMIDPVKTALLNSEAHQDQPAAIFPPLLEMPLPMAVPDLDVKRIKSDIIDLLDYADILTLASNYAKKILGRDLKEVELNALINSIKKAKDGAQAQLPNQSFLLYSLLDWYIEYVCLSNKGTGDALTFLNRCSELRKQVGQNTFLDITISLTNKRDIPSGESLIAENFRSDRGELSQNLYCQKTIGYYRETSADRLIDVVYDLFPGRIIPRDHARTVFTPKEEDYIRQVIDNAAAIEKEPSIQYLIEANLRRFRVANPDTLAVYTLCQWYTFTEEYKKNHGNKVFVRQYEMMEDRLLSALQHREKNYPNDDMLQLYNLLFTNCSSDSLFSLDKVFKQQVTNSPDEKHISSENSPVYRQESGLTHFSHNQPETPVELQCLLNK